MANLIDKLVDKRTEFILRLKQEVSKILTGDLQQDNNNLVLMPLQQARQNPYFLEMHRLIQDRPFTWETLKAIPEITGVTEIRNDTLVAAFQRATAAVDNYFRQFLEPVSSIPTFYARSKNRVEPNCVGTAQIITALYSFQNPIQDLEMLLVYSSQRRANVLKALRDLKNRSSSLSSTYDFIEANIDSFSGMFEKQDLQNLLLDHVLTLEESGHTVIRKKQGEVFDHELEVRNFKEYETCDIQEGLWLTGISQLVQLYTSLDFRVQEQWQELKPRFSRTAPKMAKIVDYSLGIGSIQDLRQVYGDDLQARYLIIDAAENSQDKPRVKRVLETLANTYAHPRAAQLIAERYLGDQANQILN